MNVTNMSWNHNKLIYDSQINDSKCQLQLWCMPTLSQTLIRRTNTNPSCCPVWPCLKSPQSKLNCKYSIHHMRKVTQKVDKDDQITSLCHFCHKKLESDKVRYHAYVVGEYSNGVEVKHYEAGQYIFTCCKKCNLQLSFNKENY